MTVPGMRPKDALSSQAICDWVVENINRFISDLAQGASDEVNFFDSGGKE